MDYLKVSSKSSPASVAGAIAGLVKDGEPVNIQCVGAGAVNQAIKAVAIARGFLIFPAHRLFRIFPLAARAEPQFALPFTYIASRLPAFPPTRPPLSLHRNG